MFSMEIEKCNFKKTINSFWRIKNNSVQLLKFSYEVNNIRVAIAMKTFFNKELSKADKYQQNNFLNLHCLASI